MENTNGKTLETLTRELINAAGAGELKEADGGGEQIFVEEEEIIGARTEICHFALKGGKEALKELAYFVISDSKQMENEFKDIVFQVDAEDAENPIGLIYKF